MDAINSINKIIVRFRGTKVGELALTPDNSRCIFQYDPLWISNGFSISPLDLPLNDSLFVAEAEPFRGNFGIFEDSLPDGYGRYLLDRILRKKGILSLALNPLQWLALVGDGGMGALTYEPALDIENQYLMPELDDMQRMALEVLAEKNSDDVDVLYYNSGNSGGCRPKCLYRDNEGEWLVKFRHTYDYTQIGKIEYEYASAAKKCGIFLPEFKLIDNKYFASKRFDIDSQGKRLHTATAAALLNESIIMPKTDYRNLLKLTGYLTQDPMAVEEMFRRMVFNVFSENKDDHVKNFTFICKNGHWTLGPAYDLTYCPSGYNGEHATSVNFNGNPTVEDMLSVAGYIRINESRAKVIIDRIKSECAELSETIRNLI